MSENMFGISLQEYLGPIKDFHEKLAGKNAQLWWGRFKMMLKEPVGQDLVDNKNKLLQLIATVKLPATPKFVVADHFVVNISDNSPVKIGFVNDNFKRWFYGLVEKKKGKTSLKQHHLLKDSVDGPILQELGGGNKAQSFLAEVLELMKLQPRGKSAFLLAEDYRANIFYIKDKDGFTRAVDVYWDTFDRCWLVNADEVAGPGSWGAGDQVFARNSSVLET